MSRRAAKFTQADAFRAIKAIKRSGEAMAVEITPDGTIRIIPAPPQSAARAALSSQGILDNSAGTAPGHTDLMVSPESIDAFLEANPLPPEPSEAEIDAAVRAFYPLPASHKISEQSIFYMRAALRAAALVREKENG